jgi:biofilm PGA synthesis N-glycosyltransferase PgaC
MSLSSKTIYVIVSPVKDEEKYIEETIRSVVSQTVKPLKWIIVDDGSLDKTPEILLRYARMHEWIDVLSTERRAERDLGSAEVLAFNMGYERVKDLEFDFVVKLDCDLRFDNSYFEDIFTRISIDLKWGIVSGIYYEKDAGGWLPVSMPDYHAAGACKIVRKKCFEEIGGFVPHKGWDTLDQIRAGLRGWKTGHFKDVGFFHLKKEGSAMGTLSTHVFHGEIYYLTGGSFPFFILKVVHRMVVARPFLLGGLMMFIGYMRPLLTRRKHLVSIEEAKFYRKTLNARLLHGLQAMLKVHQQDPTIK